MSSTVYTRMIDYLNDTVQIVFNVNQFKYYWFLNNIWQVVTVGHVVEYLHRSPACFEADFEKVKAYHVEWYLANRDYVPEHNEIEHYFDLLKASAAKQFATKQLCDAVFAELAECVAVEPNDKERFIVNIKKWMVRHVRMQYENRFYNKTMLLFTGGQDGGKSGFCEWLTPPSLQHLYVNRAIFNKDGRIELGKKFLICIDELAGLDREDTSELKNFVATSHVSERPPFGKHEVEFKRCASFIANTNKTDFLPDETGNVRFAVFKVGHRFPNRNGRPLSFDFDRMKMSIGNSDTLWAAALQLYAAFGETGELTDAEVRANEMVANTYRTVTIEEQLVDMFLRIPTGTDTYELMNTTEIKAWLEKQYRIVHHADANLGIKRLGAVLAQRFEQQQHLGCRKYAIVKI
jgi:hypothetical protein